MFVAPSGHQIEHYILDKGDGTFKVEYTPSKPGQYVHLNVCSFQCLQHECLLSCMQPFVFYCMDVIVWVTVIVCV